MTRKYKTTSVLLLLLIFLIGPLPSYGGAPTQQIQATVDKVVAILKNPSLKSEAKRKERRSQLRQVISVRFDFAEMAKRSLGSQWRRLSLQEQQEFIRLFTDLLEQAYVDRIESYNDEKFVYVRETVEPNFAEVSSRIITRKGEEFTLNYKAHFVNGEWKVYDVVVENVSLVNNYRSQFSRIIATSSYEELLRKLRQKQTELTGNKKK